MKLFCTALLALVLGILATSPSQAQTTGNLLLNAGAENGTGTAPGTVTSWTPGGTSNPGRDNGTFDPTITPHTGTYDFYGHSGASGTLDQIINLQTSGVTLTLSSTTTFSFFEQTLNQGTLDAAGVRLIFLSSTGMTLGTATSGEIANPGGWLQVSNTASIPTGTASIDYQMFFTLHAPNDLDSFIDDNSLTIKVAPEPSTWALLSLGVAGAGIVTLRRQRVAV